ncbi:MAG: DUF4405 domain-containing protein [Selenomonadaceae bacterium]|nr:DUF4405 domain-containing protein [Selenomonadaceae bacterium]
MKNFLLNAILFALFVAVMSFQLLPKVLHEILGVTLAAAILVHLSINRRRFESLTKKLSPRKIFSLTTDLLLTICAGIIFASGLCISNYLFADVVSFELRRNMTIHQLHVAAPYVMMILLGVHVGLHWQAVMKNFPKAIIMTLAAFGLAGLFINRVGDRILMRHIFGTPATELPGILFALMIAGGVILFALITFLLDKKFFAR